MKLILAVILCLLSVNTYAHEYMYDSNKPILIIRLNKDEVYYDQALDLTLDKFNTNNYNNIYIESIYSNNQNHEKVNFEVENIKDYILNKDFFKDNVTVINKQNDDIANDEIRIFFK